MKTTGLAPGDGQNPSRLLVSRNYGGLPRLWALWVGLLIFFTLWGLLNASPLNPLQVWASRTGYAPAQYQNRLTYGMGIYFAPYETTIYPKPNREEPPVEKFRWSATKNQGVRLFSEVSRQFVPVQSYFICYYPSLQVAGMSVISENGEGWAEVVYNQRTGKAGWVQLRTAMAPEETQGWPQHLGHFQTWLDFMKYNARAAGIYWLTGVSDYQRAMRTAPNDEAPLIETQLIRKLTVKYVRGNWLLVEILDFDRTMPIGWIRWRDENGRFMVFPNLEGRQSPHVLGLF